MFEYVNVIYWLLALASLVAWARFSTFLAKDVTDNLVDQPELPWKLGTVGVMLLMFIVYLVMPSFWLALPINVVIAGGMIGAFWFIRVKTLGAGGHLFRGAIEAAGKASNRMEERKNARQVQLSYVRHDNKPLPLPKADDPLATGLGIADQIVIQALMRRAEMVELVPAQNGYSLALITDGVGGSAATPGSHGGGIGHPGIQGSGGFVGGGTPAAAVGCLPLQGCRRFHHDLVGENVGVDGGGTRGSDRQ